MRPKRRYWIGLSTGVELRVDVAEAVGGDVGVDLGSIDGSVAKEFLNDAEVRSVFEKVCGEGMPEHMGRDVAGDAGDADAFFDA